jgi:hypothetical protein
MSVPPDRPSVAWTFHRFIFESGRCSMIWTRSPMAQELSSSCAMNFE